MTERERLRLLVDDLPEDSVNAALRFLQYLRSSAPDEAVTEEEPAAREEAREEEGKGRIISHDGMHRRVFGEK